MKVRSKVLALVALFALAVVARADDMVVKWNQVLLNAIRTDLTAPPRAARNMAIVHIAVYEAVNSISKTHEPYLAHVKASRGASAEAAVAAAAHRTLIALYPAQSATFDRALARSLRGIAPGHARQGQQIGVAAADQILQARANDGANQIVPYLLGNQPGDWRPTLPGFVFPPALPQWPYVTPFALESGDQFRTAGPADLDSSEYADHYHEVRILGDVDSAVRTSDETEIAFFWADGPGTATPPGHWNEIAQTVAVDRHQSLEQNARMFALLNIGLADAGIAAWDTKYVYDFWRPVTGIREGDTDGNALTPGDPDWTPLIITPAFPAYVSGHSTFSGCGATVLAQFIGTDDFQFITSSDGLPGIWRSYSSFSEAAAEAGQSRIFGGIHWQFDNVDGLALGANVGQYVVDEKLRPVRRRRDRN